LAQKIRKALRFVGSKVVKILGRLPLLVKIIVPVMLLIGFAGLAEIAYINSEKRIAATTPSPSISDDAETGPDQDTGADPTSGATQRESSISLTALEGWTLEEGSHSDLAYRSAGGSLKVDVVHLVGSNQTPQEYASNSRTLMESMGFTVSTIESYDTADFPGWEYSIETEESASLTIFLANGQSVYKVECLATAESEESPFDECRAMANTLKVQG
jgi:hypothetical protein